MSYTPADALKRQAEADQVLKGAGFTEGQATAIQMAILHLISAVEIQRLAVIKGEEDYRLREGDDQSEIRGY